MRTTLLLVIITMLGLPILAQQQLTGHAKKLYQQAMETGRFAAESQKLNPDIQPTSDGTSFFVVWKSVESPKQWIVSLHGAGQPAKGFATDDLAVWYPHLKNREVGIVCLQWWLGKGDTINDFYKPLEVYREIDLALQSLKVEPGKVMLHGFSRGSTNTYAVAAIDAGKGKHYFSLIVASSGGVSLDYPPNQALLRGEYGEQPLKGTRWITVAGATDPNSDRDGLIGMKRTASWLKEQGAIVVESIEDPKFGHGALHRNPENSKRVLDIFFKK